MPTLNAAQNLAKHASLRCQSQGSGVRRLSKVHIIGAGLAGSEAAWQVAQRGVEVILHEMRPSKKTPAHKSGNFAELVCSNSLRAAGL
ncbi:MAG: FAD-dependent oxidoreductase, partial [Selenomonadaceae bacterium]|nr:FAD-dependent oxidoreductase [Selenomonadaceae bacterium]